MTDAEQPGSFLLNGIRGKGGKPSDYTDEVFGIVKGTSPLTIWISQDLPEVGGSFLELTTEAKGLSIDVELPVSGGGAKAGQKAKGRIEVFRPLVTGDRVRMLRVQEGQRYIVFGRE